MQDDDVDPLLPVSVAVAVVELELGFELVQRSVAVEVGGEAQRRALVALFRVPSHAERVDAREKIVAEGAWNVRWESPSAHVYGEGVVWETPVRCSIHGEGLIVEFLTGHGESFARGCCDGVESDAVI